MTGKTPAGDAGKRSGAPPAAEDVLSICDRLLGEVGRRDHLFSWLRDPARGREGWLAVDGYYPRSRIVVLCGERGDITGSACEELMPAHGLSLLIVDPAELEAEAGGAGVALMRRLADLKPPPRPSEPALAAGAAHPGVIAQVVAAMAPNTPRAPARAHSEGWSAAAERGARFLAARHRSPQSGRAPRPVRALSSRPRRAPMVRANAPVDPISVLLGGALAAAVILEVAAGVTPLALGGNAWLAFALALDACARVLGALAAGRSRQQQWAWACAVIGSLAVVEFALLRPTGPERTDPAPLAGLVSVVAILVAVVGVVGRVL